MGGCSSTPEEEENRERERERANKNRGPERKTSETNSLDLVTRKPFGTYQLEKISIKKEAKKKFIEELPEEPRVSWGYKRRCNILENIILLVQNENTQEASKLLSTLTKDVCGEKTSKDQFHIDEKAAKLLHELSNTLNSSKKEFDWMTNFEKESHMLMRHLSPPVLRGYFPLQDTGRISSLSLTGVRLYKNNKKYFRLLTLLKNNPRISTLDLSFTGLTPVRANDILLYLANMEKLTCIGLRGNRLDNSCVELLDHLLKRPEMFPKLYWVDMRNNVDIIVYPQSLLDEFKNRLPDTSKHMDMRDLAEGKAVFLDDNYDTDDEKDDLSTTSWQN